MRRMAMGMAVLAVMWAGTVSFAQGMKVTSVEDYPAAMKAVAGGFGGANKALASGNLADAKTGVANAKANMQSIHAFFVDKKKDELATMAKDTVDKLAAVEAALGGTDQAAIGAAIKAVGGTCQACHMKYRDQNPETKAYSFKPGTI